MLRSGTVVARSLGKTLSKLKTTVQDYFNQRFPKNRYFYRDVGTFFICVCVATKLGKKQSEYWTSVGQVNTNTTPNECLLFPVSDGCVDKLVVSWFK